MRRCRTAGASTARAISTATARRCRDLRSAGARAAARCGLGDQQSRAHPADGGGHPGGRRRPARRRPSPSPCPSSPSSTWASGRAWSASAFYAERKVGTHTLWFAPADERPPGGESFVDLVERVRAGHRAAQRPSIAAATSSPSRTAAPSAPRWPWRCGLDAAGGARLRRRELLAHPARLHRSAGGARPVARRCRQPPPLGLERQALGHLGRSRLTHRAPGYFL